MSFAGTGCEQLVSQEVSATLPPKAHGVRLAAPPEIGEVFLDDYGDEVAEVISVGPVRRLGRRASVTITVRGSGSNCATLTEAADAPWETETQTVQFAFRAPVHVYFPHSCCGDRHSYKPRTLLLGASFALDQARWRRWDGPAAVGTARLPFNDCIPYCAAGHVTYYRVSVRLSRPRMCNRRYQYLTLTYRYGDRRPSRAPVSSTSNFGFRCDT